MNVWNITDHYVSENSTVQIIDDENNNVNLILRLLL